MMTAPLGVVHGLTFHPQRPRRLGTRAVQPGGNVHRSGARGLASSCRAMLEGGRLTAEKLR